MVFIFKVNYLVIALFCFIVNFSLAQNQKIADSLKVIYDKGQLNDSTKLELLKYLSFNELNNLSLALEYSEDLIKLSKLVKDDRYLFHGYYGSGNKYKSLGDLDKALAAFFTSAEIADRDNYSKGEGIAYMAIADVYSRMGNFENSENYYSKAIDILRKEEEELNLLGSALLNAGDDAFVNGKYDKALLYFEEAGDIFDNIGYSIGTAYNLGNIGMVYAEQGKDDLAEHNITQAISILEEIKDYYPISVYLTFMSDIYLRKNNYPKALHYAQRSLDLARKYDLKEQISDANFKLAEIYEIKGNYKDSNAYLKNYYSYRDSVVNLKSIEKIADLRTNFEVSQKQVEVDLLSEQKRNQQLISLASGIGILLILTLTIGLYRRNSFMAKAKLLIENEKEKSDILLLNILPEETAKELKDKGKVQAKKFESVSVLFTDFEGFTQYSENLSPEELVESVNHYYSKFDEIMDKYGLEKIKTIGDAYMAAGGLPFPSSDHALKLVQAAFEIAAFVKEAKKTDSEKGIRFDVRIGINTGPVVAGVVGTKKFAYDIWGDTVNIASRMESNSEPGKINISDNTYQLVKDQYECTYRGEIDAKNKGMMKMYFVEGLL